MNDDNFISRLPLGVCLIRDGVVEHANARFAQARGIAPDLLVGVDPNTLVPDIRSMIEQHYGGSVSEDTPVFLLDLHTSGGTMRGCCRRISATRYVVVEAELGDGIDRTSQSLIEACAGVVAQEIVSKEQLHFADELTQQRDELQRKVDALVHANSVKDTFLATITHELRSPLSTVVGVTEALMEGVYGELTPAQGESVGDACEAARHLLSLISDLLDLSSARLGEMDLVMEEYHVEDLLRSVQSIMREMATRKQLALTLQIPQERVVLLGDVRRMKQVFVNLLGNAIKFTPQGGYVTVRVEPDRAMDAVRVHVEDSGIGIDDSQLQHVFEPFARITSSNVPQEGTGLGLPIVQRIVDLHGGIVDVHSTPGKGSTFTVVLPWGDHNRDAEPALQGADATASDGRPVMFVVDDNAMNRRLLRDAAQRTGFAVREFGSGDGCLDALADQRPAVIVMDIRMPGMNGLETIRRVRVLASRGERIIVAALTALVMPGDRELCLAAGADMYVSKPVAYREFVHELAVRCGII